MKKKNKKKIAILFVALGLASLGIALAWRPVLDRVAETFIVGELSRRLKANVTLGKLDMTLFPPGVVVTKLEIQKSDGPLRYIGVGRVAVEPGLGAIFFGQIVIKKVEIEQPSLKIDLSDETPTAPKKKPGGFRIPTLSDLIRLKIEEIAIDGASLDLTLPGEDMRVKIGAGNAGYEGQGDSERWSWKGSGELYRGDKVLRLDRVAIVADRSGQDVTLSQFEMEGLGATVSLKGPAYPEADLFLQVRGTLTPIEKALLELGVLKQKLGLAGHVAAEGRVKGTWNNLKWSGEFRGNQLEIKQRKIPRLVFSFRVKRKTVIEAASGEIDFGGPVLKFTVGALSPGKPGTFEVIAENIPYPQIQRAIDPEPEPKLFGPVTVKVTGRAGFSPWALEGSYAITSPELKLKVSPTMDPYLPLTFKNIEVLGDVGLSKERSVLIENCTVKAEGVNGTCGFEFGPGSKVSGVWGANVTHVSGIFPKGDVVEGTGKVGGGIEARKGYHKAILDLKLDSLRYGSRAPAKAEGAIVFEKGYTSLQNVQLRTEKGVAIVAGKISNEDGDPTEIKASFTHWDLGWIGDVAARRFPIVKGVEGIGSGSVTLSGTSKDTSGTIELHSTEAFYRGEVFSRVDAVLDMERGALIFQKAEVEGKEMNASATGAIDAGRFRDFRLKLTKLPLEKLSLPSVVNLFVSHADAEAVLNGKTDQPSIKGSAHFFYHNNEQKMVSVGTAEADGELNDLAWSVDLNEGAFRAQGRVNALNGNNFIGAGTLRDFSLGPLVPSTTTQVFGDWKLNGDFRSPQSWNGAIEIQKLTMAQGEWRVGLTAPTTIAVQKGSFRLKESHFTGPSTELTLRGGIEPNGTIDAKANGRAALRLLMLFPLNIIRAEGSALIDATVSGKLSDPRFNGTMAMNDGLLQFKGFPHPIESIETSATLEQNRIYFDRLTAVLGNGNLTASGELRLAGKTEDMRVAMNGEVDHVTLRFPAWLPATLTGNLSLVGPLSKPFFRGQFTVNQARYQDVWDWQSKILSFRRGVRVQRARRSEDEHVRFDLLFRSAGDNFLLKNNIAAATLRADIRLVGTDQAYGLLGTVEVVEGKVLFLDNEFQLGPGIVNFDRADSVHFNFDLNAKTRVQQTDIILDIRTERDDIVAFLSSQPPKDETNIISLLTLGVDANELTSSKNSNQNVSSSVLPSVLAGPVQSKLESGLKRARIVDTFQFVPYFSEDTKTSGLKMIVGKQLFPRVRLLYSTDLFNAGAENTLKLEQSLNDHVSLQGSVRDNKLRTNQVYDLGLDFEFKFEF